MDKDTLKFICTSFDCSDLIPDTKKINDLPRFDKIVIQNQIRQRISEVLRDHDMRDKLAELSIDPRDLVTILSMDFL